jgi:hypothetical protein
MRIWSIAAVLTILIATHIALAQTPTTQESVNEKTLESWWADLGESEPAASQALLDFSAHPQQTTTFFKQKLRPLKITADEVQTRLTDLDSDNPAVWKPAFDDLSYRDPRLAVDLESLMDGVKQSPARQRLVALLCDAAPDTYAGKTIGLRQTSNGQFNFYSDHSSWWAESNIANLNSSGWTGKKSWNRAVRAIVLLGHIGSPDALAILKDIASGNPDAQPTQVAKAMLQKHF